MLKTRFMAHVVSRDWWKQKSRKQMRCWPGSVWKAVNLSKKSTENSFALRIYFLRPVIDKCLEENNCRRIINRNTMPHSRACISGLGARTAELLSLAKVSLHAFFAALQSHVCTASSSIFPALNRLCFGADGRLQSLWKHRYHLLPVQTDVR